MWSILIWDSGEPFPVRTDNIVLDRPMVCLHIMQLHVLVWSGASVNTKWEEKCTKYYYIRNTSLLAVHWIKPAVHICFVLRSTSFLLSELKQKEFSSLQLWSGMHLCWTLKTVSCFIHLFQFRWLREVCLLLCFGDLLEVLALIWHEPCITKLGNSIATAAPGL